MEKSKSVGQSIVFLLFLCAGLLATVGINTEAIGCISDPAHKYAGMYFMYPNELGHMWILVETDTGVDGDQNHAKLEISGSGRADPHLEYHHYDYNYWDDGSGIPGKKDRRLWVIKATGLTPDCFYDAEFKYRDYYDKLGEWLSGCWHSTWGHFHSAPQTSSTNPEHIPHELQFYAYGDTRTTTSTDELKDVAKAIMSHEGKHNLLLHTGDFVLFGGGPTGIFCYHDGDDPIAYHDDDWWWDTYFEPGKVHELLRHMPIFPTFGNHEFNIPARNGEYWS